MEQTLEAFSLGELPIRHGCLLAVLNAPEPGVLDDVMRREQADERRLEEQHHDDVAHDAERQREAEALDAAAGQEEQRERCDQRHQVGVDGCHDGMPHAGYGCRAHASAEAYLLAETLEREDRRVGRHTDGEHDARQSGKGEAEQPEGREQGEQAQVDDGEHSHRRGGDKAQPVVEEQQVEHDDDEADENDDDARGQRVLAEGRAYGLGLGIVEAHRQGAALQHGLERVGLVLGVVARDLHLAVGNLRLHGRSAVHLAIEDDDDLPVVGDQIAARVGEGLRALGIELDVNGVIGAGAVFAVDVDAADVGAGDDGGVGPLLNRQVGGVLRREAVAVVVGDGGILLNLAVLDLGLDGFVGEAVQARELEVAGLADGIEGGLRVGETGNLHEDLVVALDLHGGFRGAQGVDARLDDIARGLHILGGDLFAVGAVGGENHRQAALDVEALVDLLRRRREYPYRPHDEEGHDHEQPDVASIVAAAAFLLALVSFRHWFFLFPRLFRRRSPFGTNFCIMPQCGQFAPTRLFFSQLALTWAA